MHNTIYYLFLKKKSYRSKTFEWQWQYVNKYDKALFHLCVFKAYVDKFKFRSVLAEDALEFYLEFFPDLKEKNVHKIKGAEKDH